MDRVYISLFNGSFTKVHFTTDCKEYKKADTLLTHTMSKTLAKELRFPLCDHCKPKSKKVKKDTK